MGARLLPLLVALASASALAQGAKGVEAAKEAWTALDYETCRAAAKQSLDRAASREERIEAYRYLGLCEAALGDTAEARSAFVHMLAVDRDAELPPKLSPRFTSSFLEAKGEWLDRKPTGFELESDIVDGSQRTLRLKVVDTLGLLKEVAWRTEDGEVRDKTRIAERMELVVPKEVAKELVGFDEKGGEIVVHSLLPKEAPPPERTLASDDRPPEVDPAAEGGSFLTSPWLWLGVAAVGATVVVAVAAGAGIGFAVYGGEQTLTMQGTVTFAGDLE